MMGILEEQLIVKKISVQYNYKIIHGEDFEGKKYDDRANRVSTTL